jgi:outer membrane protein OmpA-like peptidoglycan-associated protein
MSQDAFGDQDKGGSGGHVAASFTDLMASLMVLFILLFVAALNNAGAKRAKVQSELLQNLRDRLVSVGLDTTAIRRDERDPYAIIIVMPDSLLFARGSWEVRPGGQNYIQQMIPTLSGILCANDMVHNIDNLVVEGHTDTTYTGGYSGTTSDLGRAFNLRLSQERSMEVVRMSLMTLTDEPQLPCFRGMISASGRGQEELLPDVAGDDARQRRVVFKIRVRADGVGEITSKLPPSGSSIREAP